MGTPSANYGWTIPTDQADSGTWGAELNQTLVAIDAQVKSNQNGIPSFTPVQQGGGMGQGTNKVYIGWTGSNISVQVDNSNLGLIPTAAAQGGFYRQSAGALGNPQVFASTAAPSGGSDGDLWFQYT